MLKSAAALVTIMALSFAPVPATAAPLDATVIKDGKQTGASHDITTVSLYSATKYEPAAVVIKYAKAIAPGDGLTVWFNLDSDPAPEVRLAAAAYSEYTVRRAHTWTKMGKDIYAKNCFRPSLYDQVASVEFNPNCFGPAPYVQVSVKASGVRGGTDFAPAKHRWSKRVKAFRSTP